MGFGVNGQAIYGVVNRDLSGDQGDAAAFRRARSICLRYMFSFAQAVLCFMFFVTTAANVSVMLQADNSR